MWICRSYAFWRAFAAQACLSAMLLGRAPAFVLPVGLAQYAGFEAYSVGLCPPACCVFCYHSYLGGAALARLAELGITPVVRPAAVFGFA